MRQPPGTHLESAGDAAGLRVLMTADAVGGVWTYVEELLGELSRRGADVALATMGPEPDAGQRASVERLRGVRLFPSTWELEWRDDPWADVRAAGEWLLGLEESLCPDVVHLNGFVHGSLPFRAPAVVVGHSCVLSWWHAVLGEEAPSRYRRYRTEVARGLRRADLVVAPTGAMLRELARHYGPLPHARVIWNGRSADRFPPGAEEPRVFACGRVWDGAKNLAVLGRVADRLPWPVRIAGSAVHPDGSVRRIGGVEALGRIPPEAVAREMAAASIFVHPARYEPFGLGPLEAGLAGCALVLGDIPSLREVWGERALFVPPDDEDVLVATIRRLVQDPAERRARAEAARERALALSAAAMADAYLDAYRGLRSLDTSITPSPAEAVA